jgi:anthranilate/para-aminobenzoate synthase component I
VKDHNLFSIIPYKDQLIKLEGARSARAIYQHFTIDLLNGKRLSSEFSEWISAYQKKRLSDDEKYPRIIHLFYELGFLIEKNFQFLGPDTLLAVDIEFEFFKEIQLEEVEELQLKRMTYPLLSDYRSAFEEGYQELIMGNCYQFNLTFPFSYSFEKKYTPLDFIFSLWKDAEKRGAYGSATYIPYFKKLFLSNSPECLFQYKQNIISSMPIKGTMLWNEAKSWRPLWKKLVADKKSQAELYMISDLLRNDLSRIEHPKAVVTKKKFPKLVPGLLHQYSQIDVELSNEVSLWRVIEKIFPGGSITGAPKLRAMRLIERLEKRERGFYCGSTLILFKKMKSASINIRSSTIDFDRYELLYQAGGGITLLSEVDDEYKEMTYKLNSFIRSLTP